jgi:hypothetical protein
MRNIFTYLTVLLVVHPCTLFSQSGEGLAKRPGTFEILSRTNYAMPECGFTKADMTANLERIKELVSVVRQNPVLSDIKGFNGRARIYNMSMTCKEKEWYGVPARISFEFCSFTLSKNGEVVFNTIEPPEWSLYVNDMIPGWTHNFNLAHNYFAVPLEKKTIEPGIDVYEGAAWVVYDPNRPPYWISVTVEEAFQAAREFAAREKDEFTASLNKQILDQEWAEIPESDRKKPAYFGGNLSRVASSSGYGGQDSLFPRIMKVNPEYLNRGLPKSAIQFIWFSNFRDTRYRKKLLDECIENARKENDNFCSLKRFELSFGMTDIRNLSELIGK